MFITNMIYEFFTLPLFGIPLMALQRATASSSYLTSLIFSEFSVCRGNLITVWSIRSAWPRSINGATFPHTQIVTSRRRGYLKVPDPSKQSD